eukprot:NODE_86_length_22075_cov_1.190253.p1 type:complete len:884 gc:universal NODE_86_length_22075_cov_1.190253:4274-6925(+)
MPYLISPSDFFQINFSINSLLHMTENLFAKAIDPNPEIRKQASIAISQEEQNYSQSHTQWMHYVASLCLTDNGAAVYLKNFITTKWNTMHQPDRLLVKQNIVEWIVHSSGPVRKQHLEALKSLLKIETIDILSMEHIHTLIQSHPLAATFILLEACRHFQWKAKSERGPLQIILTKIFPTALGVCKQSLISYGPEDQTIIKNIIKSFFFTMRFELSVIHRQILAEWCQISADILFKPTDGDDSASDAYKAKKWASHFLTRLFVRYGQKGSSKSPEEAEFIYTHLAPSIVQTYIQLITQFMDQNNRFSDCHPLHAKTFLPEKVQHDAIVALQYCIRYKDMWNILKSNLNDIIPNYFIPMLRLCEIDQELWENDPIEYIHSKLSSWEDSVHVRSSATLFLSEMCEKRKLMIQPLFQVIQELLKNQWQDQEAALTLIGALCYVLRRDTEFTATIESFTYECIIPAMNAEVPVLKANAFFVFSKYCSNDLKQLEQLQKAFEYSFLGLQSSLPLSVYAAISISPLLKMSQLKPIISPNIAQIMSKMLELTNVIDMDILTEVMETIVDLYSNDMIPYAVELSTSLINSFMRILKNCDTETDLDFSSDKIMTAIGIMKTIQSLILSLENSPQIVYQIEQIACPALEFVLENDFIDLFEEIFEFIDTVTFTTKSVSPLMWKFFFHCFEKLKETAADYLDQMIPCFDNFVQFGKEQILGDPATLNSINQIISGLFNSHMVETDKIPGCLLIETILLHLRGSVDSLVPIYIDMALHYLGQLDQNSNSHQIQHNEYRLALIEIVLNCIYYNPQISLTILDQKNCATTIFGFMVNQSESFKKLHDKKLLILSSCTILTSPLESIPPNLRVEIPKLLGFVTNRLQNYQDKLTSRIF